MKKERLGEAHRSSLVAVLFNDMALTSRSHKLKQVSSLLGYYSPEGVPEYLMKDSIALEYHISYWDTIQELIYVLRDFSRFRLEMPDIRRETGNNTTISPNITIDTAPITAQIDRLKEQIAQTPINLPALIAYIAKKAEERGDLDESSDVDED